MRWCDHPMASGTRYLRDMLGFELHMKQMRAQRGDTIPAAWYMRPYFYPLRIELGKMRGSGETIRFPAWVKKPDYEFELVGMCLEPIKTTCRKAAIDHMQHNMLFCIMNDCSCRDFQGEDLQLPLSISNSKGIADKSFGRICLRGRDLNMDENGVFRLGMYLTVNGMRRAETSFDTIYFNDPETGERRNWSFAEVITWFGRMNQGFEAGDLIGSGTVGNGSIAERGNIIPWLEAFDKIEMQVDRLGTLTNLVAIQ